MTTIRGGAVGGADAEAAVRGFDTDTGGVFGGAPGLQAAASSWDAVCSGVADTSVLAPDARLSAELCGGERREMGCFSC